MRHGCRMKLRDYLRANGVTYEAFGGQIGADKSQVWRWAHEERLPDARMIAAIHKATAGMVQFHDWVEIAE